MKAKQTIIFFILALLLIHSVFAIKVIDVTDTSVSLEWDEPNDHPWMYVILRNGELIGATHTSVYTGKELPPITKYTDHLLLPETTYNYEVREVYSYIDENTYNRDEKSIGKATATTKTFQKIPNRIDPQKDIVYLGAFKLPEGNEVIKDGKRVSGSSWSYSGDGMTYNPLGNPNDDNSLPGSLLGIGHAQTYFHVSEISIPKPVNSRNIDDLPTAKTLQQFKDIGVEVPEQGNGWYKGDLVYIPNPKDHALDKIYYAWRSIYTHIKTANFGRADLIGLTNKEGQWVIGDIDGSPQQLGYGRFLFTAPQEWADKNTKGMNIITGSFQSGGGSTFGISLFAIDMPKIDEPGLPNHAELDYITLLEYGPLEYYKTTDYKYDVDFYPNSMYNNNKASFWEGADWISTGDKSAIVISGSQAYGLEWYGFDDGTIYYPEKHQEDKTIYEGKGEKGHRASYTKGLFLFYDPEDLAKVAREEILSWQPQPYAVLEFNPYAYKTTGGGTREDLGAIAFDKEHGYLYAFEPKGEEGKTIYDNKTGKYNTEKSSRKSIVHVWKVQSNGNNKKEITINPQECNSFNEECKKQNVEKENIKSCESCKVKESLWQKIINYLRNILKKSK